MDLLLDYYSGVQIVLLVVAAACFVWLRRWSNGWRNSGSGALWPPGPPAWPIIGHLHLLGKLPHQSLCQLSRSFGPLIGLQLGGVPTIVASSPEMAKQIMQTHAMAFIGRPRGVAPMHLLFDCSDIGFEAYGPVWKRMRQLCAMELMSAKRLASFRWVREEEARDLARAVIAAGEGGQQAVEIRLELVAALNNMTSRMTMSKKMQDVCTRSRREDLARLTEEIMELLAVFYIGDYVPWLGFADPQGYLKRIKAAGRAAKALMQEVLQQRRQETPRACCPQDLLDVLLSEATSSCASSGVPTITDDNVMGVIMDFFVAGSSSSAGTSEWALASLVNNPPKLRKLQQELDSIVGRERLVSEMDIEKLPYLSSVLKETLRLYPAAPLIPHESTEECQIRTFKIPPRTRTYINIWAIGRDLSVWERPLEFWPERFDASDVDLYIGQNFKFFPFGVGRRSCPGWALGVVSVRLMIATLVHGFDWTLVPQSSKDCTSVAPLADMSERFGLTLTLAKPLRAFATPRLPPHVY